MAIYNYRISSTFITRDRQKNLHLMANSLAAFLSQEGFPSYGSNAVQDGDDSRKMRATALWNQWIQQATTKDEYYFFLDLLTLKSVAEIKDQREIILRVESKSQTDEHSSKTLSGGGSSTDRYDSILSNGLFARAPIADRTSDRFAGFVRLELCSMYPEKMTILNGSLSGLYINLMLLVTLGGIFIYGFFTCFQLIPETALPHKVRYHSSLSKRILFKGKKLLENLRLQDPLTSLSNRSTLEKDIALKKEKFLSLILINIDNFSSINTAFGWRMGNSLLRVFSHRLRKVISPEQKLYRVSGDEFAIVAIGTQKTCVDILNNIDHKVGKYHFRIKRDPIPLSYSIGVSTGKGKDHLMQAGLALRVARESKNRKKIVFFTEAIVAMDKLKTGDKRQINIVAELKSALRENRAVPFYQAIQNNRTDSIEKYECLARIVKRDNKILSPFNFMEISRKYGFYTHITETIIEQAFHYFRKTHWEFTLNINEDDLLSNNLREMLLKASDKNEIPPRQVILEVVEYVSFLENKRAIVQLETLKKDGFQIAIDDFGSERSNFDRIMDIQVDYLKIYGKLIERVGKDEPSYESRILRAIVNIAKAMGIKTIAEYVHSEKTQKYMKEFGVDYSQGAYISKPTATPL